MAAAPNEDQRVFRLQATQYHTKFGNFRSFLLHINASKLSKKMTPASSYHSHSVVGLVIHIKFYILLVALLSSQNEKAHKQTIKHRTVICYANCKDQVLDTFLIVHLDSSVSGNGYAWIWISYCVIHSHTTGLNFQEKAFHVLAMR